MRATTFVLEWRHGGHRLAYVAAIVRAGAEAGERIVLATSLGARQSAEYATHLAGLEELGVLEAKIESDLGARRATLFALRSIRRSGSGVVLPEADEMLPLLLLAFVSRCLPKPTAIILMRPPRHDGARNRLKGVLKFALISSFRVMRRSFDIHLLEDPLAEGNDRIWRSSLSGAALRLDDPSDLFGGSSNTLPSELTSRIADEELLVVLGSIDSRKRVPLIIDAWRQCQTRENARLVIAGRQQPDVTSLLRQTDVVGDSTIITIDRYLHNAEMGALLRRAKGIFILYDGGLSSGLLVTAASFGRWIIALEGTRTGRVAADRSLAELCTDNPAGVARAIDVVIRSPGLPSPIPLSNSMDFGARVLRRVVVSSEPYRCR